MAALVACALATALAATGCQASEQATGASFSPKTNVQLSTFDQAAATGENGALVDSSHASNGYVGVSATATSRLKVQVISGQETTNYDLAQDGTASIFPLTAGAGTYTVRVMQNTSGNNYVELYSTSFEAAIASETEPFLYPNVNCNYTSSSACVSKARDLVSGATNQGEAVKAICNWIVENISYDDDKASQLKDATGYVPNPDSTLSAGSGICFDYASLGAAMLRSQGIPTKIVTGYVSPGDIYHSWIMVYIDGTWKSARFNVTSNTWSRVDLTFAASSDNENVGDGKSYTDRYVY